MPELPEVETVMRGLAPVMEGFTIERADIRRPDLRWPFPSDFRVRLSGQKVVSLGRRSKYLLAHLGSGETLIVHLGMSGRMQISGVSQGVFYQDHAPLEKHDHVVLEMSGGARITFNDPRRFGAMDLARSDALEQHRMLAKIGPEPLGNSFDADYLFRTIKSKRSPIKSVLLDQRVVAGLGNIYVCEALHRAGISPKREAGRLSKVRVDRLVPIIRDVLSEAIQAGGSSLQDHRQADGELGYFQHNFQAYDRENEPCAKIDCGGRISRIVQSGRSTFYCAKCQR